MIVQTLAEIKTLLKINEKMAEIIAKGYGRVKRSAAPNFAKMKRTSKSVPAHPLKKSSYLQLNLIYFLNDK